MSAAGLKATATEACRRGLRTSGDWLESPDESSEQPWRCGPPRARVGGGDPLPSLHPPRLASDSSLGKTVINAQIWEIMVLIKLLCCLLLLWEFAN